MKDLKMFCTTLEPSHHSFIKSLGYIPFGLGKKNFNEDFFRDNSGKNIAHKNENYAECTGHYWIWKNYLDKLDNTWIGFCHYRKYWGLRLNTTESKNINVLNTQVIKKISSDYEKYESILGEPFYINQFIGMKFIKKGLGIIAKKPLLLFDKNRRNLNFHFDLMHGENNLNKAINLLDPENKADFRDFVNNEVSFNPYHMFICQSKEKVKKYYETLFPWLEKCEKLFGFNNLKGYGKVRIYAFLAERFMSYWFQKNTKYTTLPIVFYDIRNDIS